MNLLQPDCTGIGFGHMGGDMKLRQQTKQKIESGWQYDVLFGNGLANHLPMALSALDFMGADGEQISRFHDHYCRKLEPLRPVSSTVKLQQEDIEAKLGKRDLFLSYLHFFRDEIGTKGIESVLGSYLDLLFPGVAASAFHPLIRLAYALEMNNEEEVAISLAFWGSEFQSSGQIGSPTAYQLQDIFTVFGKRFLDFKPNPGIIAEKIRQVSRDGNFKVEQIQPQSIVMDQVAALTLELFLQNGDFILLHGITATHAMRIVLPFSRHPGHAIRCFWQAMLAAVLVTGVQRTALKKRDLDSDSLSVLDKNTGMERGEGRGKQIADRLPRTFGSTDDHTIKLVYSCWREHAFYGFGGYLDAIEKRLADSD